MKTALIFFAVLLVTCTVFARARSILVEVTVQKDGTITASIYSEVGGEQRLDTSVADAASVLEQASQPTDTLFVYILANGFLRNEPLWELLDGLKKNPGAKLSYFEVDHGFVAGLQSRLSEHGKQLQATFKVPECTKAIPHQ